MNIIASFLLTNYRYPFWNYAEKPNALEYTEAWRKSIEKLGLASIVFIDEEQPQLEAFVSSKFMIDNIGMSSPKRRNYRISGTNQIDFRWEIAYEFLKWNRHIENFFMTDISDVTVLKNPFDFIEKGKIYVGDEACIIGENEWIKNRVDIIEQLSCKINYIGIKNKQILNCGIFGGHRETILPVLEDMSNRIKCYGVQSDTVDMIALNEVLYSCYSDKIIHGKPLNTEFWKWDFNNKECYFQHK
jgi:hypothetical protein